MAHQLYRHFDRKKKLLYVGISNISVARLASHKTHSNWFNRIATVTIENYLSRKRLFQKEREAIRKEHPMYNRNNIPVIGTSKKYQQFLKIAKSRRQAIIRAASFFGTRLTAEKFKISRQRVNQIVNGK